MFKTIFLREKILKFILNEIRKMQIFLQMNFFNKNKKNYEKNFKNKIIVKIFLVFSNKMCECKTLQNC